MDKLEGDNIPGLLMLVGFGKASDTVVYIIMSFDFPFVRLYGVR
jgi:hypothetical protein